MDIEKILNDSQIDESVAFLSSLIPMVYSDSLQRDTIESRIDLKGINEKIQIGPKSYIKPVCIDAANQLRWKNIYVLASLKIGNRMYLILDKLNDENMTILKNKCKENPENYFLNLDDSDYFGIRVNRVNKKTGQKISNEFLSLISEFRMQDIQRGYFNEKNFLMNICDCEKVEGLKEFQKSDANIVFDINKMDKSFREYLKDSGYEQYYLQDEHRIYLNEFYYNAHLNYLNRLEF